MFAFAASPTGIEVKVAWHPDTAEQFSEGLVIRPVNLIQNGHMVYVSFRSDIDASRSKVYVNDRQMTNPDKGCDMSAGGVFVFSFELYNHQGSRVAMEDYTFEMAAAAEPYTPGAFSLTAPSAAASAGFGLEQKHNSPGQRGNPDQTALEKCDEPESDLCFPQQAAGGYPAEGSPYMQNESVPLFQRNPAAEMPDLQMEYVEVPVEEYVYIPQQPFRPSESSGSTHQQEITPARIRSSSPEKADGGILNRSTGSDQESQAVTITRDSEMKMPESVRKDSEPHSSQKEPAEFSNISSSRTDLAGPVGKEKEAENPDPATLVSADKNSFTASAGTLPDTGKRLVSQIRYEAYTMENTWKLDEAGILSLQSRSSPDNPCLMVPHDNEMRLYWNESVDNLYLDGKLWSPPQEKDSLNQFYTRLPGSMRTRTIEIKDREGNIRWQSKTTPPKNPALIQPMVHGLAALLYALWMWMIERHG